MKPRKLSLATRSMMVAATLGAASATPESAPRDDKTLAEMIARGLGSDDRLEAGRIKVTVEDGIAVLTGDALTLAQAERAAERAKSAAGIRAVVNQLEIAPPKTTGAALAESVRRHLLKNRAIDARRVKVAVDKRKAVLSGEVGTWDEQELAREIATEIPGITRIENRLEVSFDTVRTDQAIRSQIAYQIADDPRHHGANISIEVKDGVVNLAGEVASAGGKDLLVHRAYVTGVTEVWADNVMVVGSPVPDGMTGGAAATVPDLEALRQAFGKDKRLRGAGIVSSFDGNVLTLIGTAPSEEATAAAESTARGLPGVKEVVNRIGQTANAAGGRFAGSVEEGR